MEQLQSIGTLICVVLLSFTAAGIPWALHKERQDAGTTTNENDSQGGN